MRPMLAGPYVPELIRYPVIVQPKLDGIRGVVAGDGYIYSRNLKRIPNQHIQECLFSLKPHLMNFDGELMVGDPTAEDAYRVTDSGVMSHGGEPDFTYMVFDMVSESSTYTERREFLEMLIPRIGDPRIVLVEQKIVNDENGLMAAESEYIARGYEGVILRSPDGLYKHGRSTPRQGWLIKLKRFEDSDAEIIGFEQLYSNQNEAKQDAFGLVERSSHQANMVPVDTLGALLVRDVHSKVEFRIGSFKGLDMEARRAIWQAQDEYLGKVLTYKFQKVGGYDRPRFPIFKGWRGDLL